MWSASRPSGLTKRMSFGISRNPGDWAALHPVLGEAFMSTVAAAAARDEGLEVVTDNSHVHRGASSRDEETIYQTLIHGRFRAGASDPEMTLRLAHLVIVGGFDVSKLSPEDLAAMSTNREALFDFRRHLAERVAEIPEMDSETKREAHLGRSHRGARRVAEEPCQYVQLRTALLRRGPAR